MYGVMFPLISGPFRSSLEASQGGAGVVGVGRGCAAAGGLDSLSLRIESGDASIKADSIQDIVFVATGADPYALVHEGMRAVQRQLKTFQMREVSKHV